MRPLLISKANTVLQLLLVGGYISHAAFGTPEQGVLWGLEVMTAGTTAASLAAYAWMYATGRMLAMKQAPSS
jgi:cardiolipin synthase